MSNQSFKVKNSLTLTPVDLTTITNPQAGDLACDVNDSNKIKRYDAVSASWTEVGSGAAGDVDTLLVQTFDSASLSSFTQTGLELVTGANSINGTASARLIHQAASTRSFKQTISVPAKFRGQNMTLALTIRSTATSGNVTLLMRDETNSTDIQSQQVATNSTAIASLTTSSGSPTISGFTTSNIANVQVNESVTGPGIPTGTRVLSVNTTALTVTLTANATASATVTLNFSDRPRTSQFGFAIPDNCSSISYTISALQEANSPETYVDDVKISNYWLGTSVQGQSLATFTIPNATDWQDYSASGSWGNTTYIGKYRRVGENMELQVRATVTGAVSGGLQINLPAGFAADVNKLVNTSIQLPMGFGSLWDTSASQDYVIYPLYQNTTSLFIAYSTNVNTGVAALSSTAPITIAAGDIVTVTASIPIQGWTATSTQTVTTTDLVPAKAVLGNTSLSIPKVTDWVDAGAITLTGPTKPASPTADKVRWRRVGEFMEISYEYKQSTAGTGGSNYYYFGIPGGYQIDTTKLSNVGTSDTNVGNFNGRVSDGSTFTDHYSGYFYPATSTTLGVYAQWQREAAGATAGAGLLGTGSGGIGSMAFASVSYNGVARVPIVGWTATEAKVVSGTQQALVQDSDSYLKVDNYIGTGSSSTRVPRFGNIRTSKGDAFTYNDSATDGASITVLKSGTYTFTLGLASQLSAYGVAAITKNETLPITTATGLVSQDNLLALTYIPPVTSQDSEALATWTGFLNAGDVIRPRFDNSLPQSPTRCYFTASYQGSLKVLNTNSNQRATIPTHELRFTGSSSRGTADGGTRVKFDTLANIKGDAFTYVNDATGTSVTINKPGRLAVTTSLVHASTGTYFQIWKSGTPVSGDAMTQTGGTASWVGDVVAGDTIVVVAGGNSVANPLNSLYLSLQEQSIQVSVSNTLPQFSESDSSVRVSGANGFGSTATTTRRFSSVAQNIGSAIQYVDNAALGGQFIAQESGIYTISYTENSTANVRDSGVFIRVNGAAVAYDNQIYNTASADNKVASASWTGYLNQGDVVTGTAVSTNNGADAIFTISKVGKPNVTGVDVTPFVSVPQPVTQSSYVYQTATFAANNNISGALTGSNNSGIYSYNASTGAYTLLKAANVTMTASANTNAASPVTIAIRVNGVDRGVGTASATIGYWAHASITTTLQVGDVVTIWTYGAGTTTDQRINFMAEALSDQILTAPQTFSTDTAALTYASSAQYTLSTLANAPVGTYITFTYAANGNVATQTTTRPTQTDADMNTNGILIYSRAYNATSTAAQPSRFQIQIGKGLKGLSLNAYKSSGKSISAELDYFVVSTNSYGLTYRSYNEVTGILTLDAGANDPTVTNTAQFRTSDVTSSTSAYITINASTNPALTGMNLNRVAAKWYNTSAQSIPNSTLTTITGNTTTYDTHGAFNPSTGLYTVPETGYYNVSATIYFATNTGVVGAENMIYLTTGERLASYFTETTASIGRCVTGSRVIRLNKGDVFGFQAYQNSGGARSLVASDSGFNVFSITKVSI